jgi:TRAP-type C4-dicarboxylate transport system substrate-binding protein
MERGVVDGFVMNAAGFVDTQNWHEITKYMIRPGFYRGGLTLVVNQQSWNRLSEDLQRRIKEYKSEVWNSDPDGGLWFLDYNSKQTKLIGQNGVEVVELSPEDARDYLQMAYDSAWALILEKEPVRGARLKKLLFDEDLLPQ